MWADFAEVRDCRFRVLPISAKSAHMRNRPARWQILPFARSRRIGNSRTSNSTDFFDGDSSAAFGFEHSLRPRHAD